MVSISQLKAQIRRDAAAYDRLAREYNALIRKEKQAGRLVRDGSGKVVAANTAAGKAAGKRVVTAWNKVARKGQRLKAELEMYTRYRSRVRKSSSSRSTATRKTVRRRR